MHMYEDLELYNLIGKKIKNRRHSLGITQEKLAEITHYSLSFIANIESRTYQTFSISALNNIAKALNTNILNLLPNEKDMEKEKIQNKLKCGYCNYDTEIPIEFIKLMNCIKEVTNKKIKLTCPKCHKKIV